MNSYKARQIYVRVLKLRHEQEEHHALNLFYLMAIMNGK